MSIVRIPTSELKKLFGSKYVLILLALLFAANLAVCNIEIHSSGSAKENMDELEHAVSDYLSDPDSFLEYKATIDKMYELHEFFSSIQPAQPGKSDIEFAEDPSKGLKYSSTQQLIVEKKLLDQALTYVDKFSSYREDLQNYIANEEKLLAGMPSQSLIYLYTQQIINVYKTFEAKNVQPKYEIIRGWDQLFNYDYIGVFLLVGSTVIACAVMINDRSIGFYSILSSTKNGRRKTVCSKLLTVTLLSGGMTLLFSVSVFGLIAIQCGFSSYGNSIQAIDTLRYAPYSFSMIGYAALQLVVRVLTVVSYSTLICLISILVRNYLYAYLSSLLLAGSQLWIHLTNTVPGISFLKINNLFALLQVNGLFNRYRAFAFCGDAVNNLYLLAGMAVVLGLFAFTTSVIFCHSRRTFKLLKPKYLKRLRNHFISKKENSKLEDIKTGRHPISLYSYEIKKIFSPLLIALILIALFGISVWLSYKQNQRKFTYNQAIYYEYIDKISGELDDTAEQYILNEKERLQEQISLEKRALERYNSGQIDYEEYRRIREEAESARYCNDVFQTVLDHRDYIIKREKNTGQSVWFVHNIGWEQYFSKDFDFLLYLCVLLISYNLFSCEYAGTREGIGFYPILSVSKKGLNPTLKAKLLTLVGIITFFFLLFIGTDLFLFIKAFGLNEVTAPLASLEMYEGITANISILVYLLLSIIVKYIAYLLLGLITAGFSQLSKKPIPTLTLTLLVTLVPHILVLLGVKALMPVDFTGLLSVHSTVRYFASIPSACGGLLFFFISVGLWLIACAVFVLIYSLSFVGKKRQTH